MAEFVKGDVIVLPFPFSDLTTSKKRPALVVAPPQTYNDVILCMITSKTKHDGSAIAISEQDFENGRLPQESHVRPNRIFTPDANIILRRAGRLSAEKVDAVMKILRVLESVANNAFTLTASTKPIHN